MLISLIIGTLNRARYLSYCLESISKQTYSEYEIIIIDQSDNDETQAMVNAFNFDRMIYKKVKYKGLSRARNEAIQLSSGDIICLVDDDAFYEHDYLEKIIEHYNNKFVLSGFLINAKTNQDFVNYSKVPEGKPLSYWQITRYCPSPGLSFPRQLIDSVGLFDENFGVGAKYGAAEETDLLIRAKRKGYSIVHFKDIKARHPHEKIDGTGIEDKTKSYNYSYGIGAMYKKNTKGNLFNAVGAVYVERVARDIIKGLIAKEDWELFNNLTRGFREYKN